MKLIALMPVRNEDWIVGLSARVALMWCDEIIILDHCSTDSTPRILLDIFNEYPNRVMLIREEKPEWKEMEHRQMLLARARGRGATHIAIVDADEVLTGNLLPTIRSSIEELQPGQALQTGMLAMWRSFEKYRVGHSIWANRFDLTLAFCDHPSLHWAAVNGYDHHARMPRSAGIGPKVTDGGVMHLQWSSWRRLVAKHARYKMDERLKYPDKSVAEIDRMYSMALDEQNLELKKVPGEWWTPYLHLLMYTNRNEEPWQERQCREWMDQYGTERFKGMDLFGVV